MAVRMLLCMLLGLATGALRAAPEELTFHWATACHDPLDPKPVFQPKSNEQVLLPGHCMEVTGERPGYDGGFSPVMDGDRLLLVVTGRTFPPGRYQLDVTARLNLPLCTDCDGYCAQHQRYQETGLTLTRQRDEAGEYLVFDLKQPALFPQWQLLGVRLDVQLNGPELAGEPGARVHFTQWPWCL